MIRHIIQLLRPTFFPFVIVSFSLAVAGSALAQDNDLDSWEKQQVSLLDKELKLVAKSLDCGPLKVSQQTKDTIRQFPEADRKSDHQAYLFCVPPPIRDSLWATLREKVAEEDLEKLNEHITVAEAFVESSRADAISCMVVFLDNHLFLSKQQSAELESALTPNWSDVQNFPIYLFTFRSLRTTPILESLDQEAIKKILTPEQAGIFDKLDKLAVDPHVLLSQAHDAPEFEFSAAQECLKLSTESMTNELGRYVAVTEKQKRILNVARNGAANSIRKKWMAASDLNKAENETLFTTPLVTQLLRQPIFQKTVQRTLGDQFENYEAERFAKAKSANAVPGELPAILLFQQFHKHPSDGRRAGCHLECHL